MQYLLASDFDGTLCRHHHAYTVSDEDREAVRRFRAAGNKVAIVTGRMYESAVEVFNATDFHDMDCVLCLSGAYGFLPDGTELYDRRADGKRLSELADFFRSTGARYMNLDVGKHSYEYDIGGDYSFGLTPFSKEMLLSLDSFTSMNVGYHTCDRAHEVCGELCKSFSDVITPLQNLNAIDMPPVGVNKATAAKFAADMFGVPEDHIYTVGDSYNDIHMVKTYNGSAMETGPDELKSAARRTVKSVSEIISMLMDE